MADDTALRVEVDATLCVASGQCATTCPSVFRIEDGAAVVVHESVEDAALQGDVLEAMDACPTQAISVTTNVRKPQWER